MDFNDTPDRPPTADGKQWKNPILSTQTSFLEYLPFEEGLKVEQDLFMKLMTGSQSAAQRYIFFAQRQVTKIPDIEKDTEIKSIESVGVIGAGTMGGGISMNFANVGIPVTIIEQSQERLDKGLSIIRKNYENTAAKGRITSDQVEERMNLINGQTTCLLYTSDAADE